MAQTAQGLSDANKAKKAIENFKRQDIDDNPYANIQISTEKADQQTRANLSSSATSVEALRRGGTRAVIGGIPKVNENSILLQNIISADIERQDVQRQQLIARGEESIRNIRENRETRALAGLGQQLQSGRQTALNGASNIVRGGLSLSTQSFGGGNDSAESSTDVSQSSNQSNVTQSSLFDTSLIDQQLNQIGFSDNASTSLDGFTT